MGDNKPLIASSFCVKKQMTPKQTMLCNMNDDINHDNLFEVD